MAQHYLYSDNDSETMADALKAVGLAEVAQAWLRALGVEAPVVEIEDQGDHYQIGLPVELDQTAIERITRPFVVGRGQPLVGKKQRERAEQAGAVGGAISGFPYEEEQERKKQYFAQREKLAPADRKRFAQHPEAEEFAHLRDLTPHPNLPLYVYVNHFKVADGYNGLLERWQGESVEAFHANLACVLKAFASHPNALEIASAHWEAAARSRGVDNKQLDVTVTQLQLVNPASGKGNNAYKASGLSIGNLSGFWLVEYLKVVGLFSIAAPVMIANVKDRKTYVLHPVKIEVSALHEVMETFRSKFFATTAIKQDILAVLRFTQALIEVIARAMTARAAGRVSFFGIAPRITNIARGFDVASYKDMGSAYATMNLATVNLPNWFTPIATPADAQMAEEVLREHEQVVLGIKTSKGEEGSEEIELLRRYRDFLSGHEVERLFDFAALYGDYYLAKRHHNQWAGQFTTDGLERLVAQAEPSKDKPLLPAVTNEGFKAVATAIRRATVTAQYVAARESGYPYEVRYGLGQELLRAAAYPREFLAALGEFVQMYNAENARIDERIAKKSLPDIPRNRRASVRTEHLNEIVGLVDSYDSEVICKLLVAYGYARDAAAPREEPPPDAGQEGSADIGG